VLITVTLMVADAGVLDVASRLDSWVFLLLGLVFFPVPIFLLASGDFDGTDAVRSGTENGQGRST
jgi:hypothetical protein